MKEMRRRDEARRGGSSGVYILPLRAPTGRRRQGQSTKRGTDVLNLSMRTVEVETRTDRTSSLSKGRDRAREEFCSPRARMAWTLGRRGIESRDARLLVHTKYVSTHGGGTWEERVLIKKNSQ